MKKSNVDIFSWANRVDGSRDELLVELFLINKNFTVYSLPHSDSVEKRIHGDFLFEMINTIERGAAVGMPVIPVEKEEERADAIRFADLEKVGYAHSVIDYIENSRDDILQFKEEEHEIRRMRGIIAKYSYKDKSREPFYAIKYIQSSQIMTAKKTWEIDNTGTIGNMTPDSVIAMNNENQMLVANGQIFIFNLAKFVALFKYDLFKYSQLEEKIKSIEENFKLSYPEGLSMMVLANGSKQLADKLLDANPSSISQDTLIEQSDEFQLALMTDDAGAIIIMDTRDASMFLNLLNDNYLESKATGSHYVATKKKEVFATEDKQLNLNV